MKECCQDWIQATKSCSYIWKVLSSTAFKSSLASLNCMKAKCSALFLCHYTHRVRKRKKVASSPTGFKAYIYISAADLKRLRALVMYGGIEEQCAG